ncbi:MAG: DUF1501 domain-containing protein [Casimicrobiaceae bacterium]|nr:DUF1501 domain-containing protein [Casimicrobiaceae bacterium]
MQRRQFLTTLSTLATAPSLLAPRAHAAGGTNPAADETGYKALVCVFLWGGNDSHNTVVPYQGAEYNAYATARGGPAEQNGLALPQGSLDTPTQRLGTTGLALHPAMTRLASLYNAGKLAIVCNCGPLIDETTLAQYRSGTHPLPPALFSHSDQQMHWQTGIPDQPADTGWGGRLADQFRLSQQGRLPVGIAVGGAGGIFFKGEVSQAYSIQPVRYSGSGASASINTGSPIVRIPAAPFSWISAAQTERVFREAARHARDNLLEQQYQRVVRASIEVGEFVRTALYGSATGSSWVFQHNPNGALNVEHWFPGNPLAAQLHAVAAMIAARAALGARRQIFFVGLGGFDNHGDQFGRAGDNKSLLAGKHFELLRFLDEALWAFYQATVRMGVAELVTTMTMSDFGRTMRSNGDGSDHGWGGHYFVLGDAVRGARLYGAEAPGAADTGYYPWPSQWAARQLDVGEGRLLPTLSTDTYLATLARWLGADASETAAVFPNLARFNVQSLNLFV